MTENNFKMEASTDDLLTDSAGGHDADGVEPRAGAVNEGPDRVSTSSEAGNIVVYVRTNVVADAGSIQRQLDAVDRYLKACGYGPAPHRVSTDEARPGATMVGRDGLRSALAACSSGGVDLLCVESLDRLSRDVVELSSLAATLMRHGVELHAVASNGKLAISDFCFEGFSAAERSRDQGLRIRLGRETLVRDGRWPHVVPFGYRAVPGEVGRLVPEQHTAAAVRLAFNLRLDGLCPRAVAEVLNERRIPTARGRSWSRHNVRRMLKSTIYRGYLVFGETGLIDNPLTGRKIRRAVSQDKWVVKEVPELAIVTPEVWHAAQR